MKISTSINHRDIKASSPIAVLVESFGIDLNVIGETALTFKDQLTAEKTTPLVLVIKTNSGIPNLAACSLKLNGVVCKVIDNPSLQMLTSKLGYILLSFDSEKDNTSYSSIGDYSFSVSTINGSNCKIDISIIGIKH